MVYKILKFLGRNKFLDNENGIKYLVVVTYVCIVLWSTKHLHMLSYLILSFLLLGLKFQFSEMVLTVMAFELG